MAYVHTNKAPITLVNDPVDPDSTDWVYFSYQNWKRTNETITAHSALIEGGTIVLHADLTSTYIGTVIDSLGVSYTDCYGVHYSVIGPTELKITHRVNSSVTGTPDLGRTNIDHTVVIKVKSL